MNITEVFRLLSEQVQNEILTARAALNHPGMKGAVTEQVVTDFLRRHLPPNLGLTSGILIDSEGGVSRQLDIIIFDSNKTPSLFLAGGIRVIPVECAYAVIEVKMQLNSEHLQSCIQNMQSVKSLKRIAYYPPGQVILGATTLYGIQKDFWWETLYFVFAFEAKLSSESIGVTLTKFAAESELNKRIDSLYCLDLGYIVNQSADGVDALPGPGSGLVLVRENSLLLFYGCLSRYLNQAVIPKFSFNTYLKNIDFNCQALH